MAERKVLNKYYPPDFDPSKLRRFEKKTVRRMCNVRMMLPMSVRCYTCQNYMYLGTKFNMKVETVSDEDYLGIKVYRFYFKCTQCYGEITFKTDPKNHDYVSEWGASRNHEQWKDMLMAEEEFKEIKQSEMKEDAMKSLEHRTYDSKREMDILDALDQVKTLNRRQANVNYDELIEKAVKEKDREIMREEEKKDEEEAKEKFKKLREKRIEDYNLKEEANSDLLNKKIERTEIKNDKELTKEKDYDSEEDSISEKEIKKDGNFNAPKFKIKVQPTNIRNNIIHSKGQSNNTIINSKNNVKINPKSGSSSLGLNLLNAYADDE